MQFSDACVFGNKQKINIWEEDRLGIREQFFLCLNRRNLKYL
jgi:hypothetical protein